MMTLLLVVVYIHVRASDSVSLQPPSHGRLPLLVFALCPSR